MKDINGISWLHTDYTTLSLAHERLRQQCPMTAQVKQSMVATDVDPYAEQFEWNQAQARIQESEQIRQQRLQREAPIHNRIVSKPVPTYSQLVQQHQS